MVRMSKPRTRILAAEEQLLEDRQLLRAAERVDVLGLRAHAERQPRVLPQYQTPSTVGL